VPDVSGSNEQDDHPVDLEALCALCASALTAEGVPDAAEVSLLMVGTAEMASLNVEHRGKQGPTDVLSFTIDDVDDAADAEVILLGDLVICPAVAATNAIDHGVSLAAELELLVVHGSLHLLGWDHEIDEEAEAMEARESDLLAKFGTAERSAR
jgi:probable rRNA maturation factor